MDYYKKKKINNLILLVIFIVGIVLQIVGQSIESYVGLAIQLISLVLLLTVLFLYNKRFK